MIWYNDNYGQNKIRIYGEEQNMMFEVLLISTYTQRIHETINKQIIENLPKAHSHLIAKTTTSWSKSMKFWN